MDEQPLLIVQDKATGKQWELPIPDESLQIGREGECGLCLPDRQVSRHHAVIYRAGGHYLIRDTGSRNGTLVNSDLVMAPRPLQDGDEISIASRYRITFVGSEATAPLYRAVPQRKGLYLDKAGRRVWVDGVELDPPLSMSQYQLLELLVGREGGICTRDDIVEAIYAEDSAEGITDQAIDALIRRLRERLAETGSQHPYIETIRGHGFRVRQP